MQRLSDDEVAVMSLRAGVMLKASVPIVRVFELLELGPIGDEITDLLSSGHSLSDSLKRFPHSFSAVYVRLILLGEQTGQLAEVFIRVSSVLLRRRGLRNKLAQGLFYPAALLVVCLLLCAFLGCFMLPRLLELVLQAGTATPWPTRVFLQVVTNPVLQWSFVAGLVLLVSFLGLAFRGKLRLGGLRGWLLYRSPLLGPLNRDAALARFVSDLALVLAQGLGLEPGLRLLQGSTGDPDLDLRIGKVAGHIRLGQTFSWALQEEGFPNVLSSLIASSEESGRMDTMLTTLAGWLEDEVETRIEITLQLIEPLVLMVMGSVVGMVVLAAFLPIYSLIQMPV